MPASCEDKVKRIFADALDSLIQHYTGRSPSAERSLSVSVDMHRYSSIRFSGEHIEGSATLLLDVITRESLGITSGDLNDWLMEMANQLAGRFKNRMLQNGSLVTIGLPTHLEGKRILYLDKHVSGCWHANWPDCHLYCILSLQLSPEFRFNDMKEEVAEEGSVNLF